MQPKLKTGSHYFPFKYGCFSLTNALTKVSASPEYHRSSFTIIKCNNRGSVKSEQVTSTRTVEANDG